MLNFIQVRWNDMKILIQFYHLFFKKAITLHEPRMNLEGYGMP
jgi:hypothetical protein